MLKFLVLLLALIVALVSVHISRTYVRNRPQVCHPPSPMEYKVTQEQLERLHRDGAVLLPGVLNEEWLDYMTKVVEDRVSHPYLGSIPSRLLGIYEYHQFDNWIAAEGFMDFLTLGSPTSIAKSVFPSWKTIRVLKESLFYKPRAEYPSLLAPLHLDVESGAEDPLDFDVFRLWVSLDPVPKGRGVVFQTNTHGNARSREEEFSFKACPDEKNHSRYLAWDMQAGDGLVWFGDTAHFAYGGDRRVVSMSLIEGSTSVFKENKKPHLSWDWYDHGVEDGDIISGPYFPQIYPGVLPGETEAREDGKVQYFSGSFEKALPFIIDLISVFGGGTSLRCRYDVPFTK